MDSDIELQDDGTVEVIGNSGYLSVGDGNVVLGSSDSGTFKGFTLGQDGTVNSWVTLLESGIFQAEDSRGSRYNLVELLISVAHALGFGAQM